MLPSSPGWSARLAMTVNLPARGGLVASIVTRVACFVGSKKRPPHEEETVTLATPVRGGLSAGLPCEGAACGCGLVGCKVLERGTAFD